MFQQTTEICLRSLALLISYERGTVVQSREIGDRLGISSTYVAKAFQPLARKGWLKSIKGRSGGWVLSIDPAEITLVEAVEALEPNDQWKRCVVGHSVCSGDTACPFHETWSTAVEGFERVMRSTPLARLPQFLPPCWDMNERDVLGPGGRRAGNAKAE